MNIYQTVIIGSTALAGAVIAIFLLLLLRRHLAELSEKKNRHVEAAVTRSYLRRVAGYAEEGEHSGWTHTRRMAAVAHVQALLRGGERARLMEMAELDGLLAVTLRRSHSWRRAERINAIRLLQRFGSEACIARIRALMARDRSQRVRMEAAFALAAMHALPPPREIMRLLRMPARRPSRLDVALLRTSSPQYSEQLVLLLDDDLSGEWRAELIDALGWSGNMEVIGLLKHAARYHDPEIRCAALRAAAKLGHPSARSWVLRALDDEVTSVRVQAVNACAALGLREASDKLREMRADPQLWVRLRAELALERLTVSRDKVPTAGAAAERDAA
ncbi:HEAT repeat domain-containing protein [Erythrobacter sp. LQ02-29]|uniref:HEAT repeat domain-containing protein n=1 Tax=Erythrobacter sp. LQ02-29 TaxID=2920384 RepID=UPI001F4E9A5A|nr:HEAT repeat domain-containing protein [Erythrobacter sp. LQ02-29]MCP9223614.1 HEAT repeat domain-containing protein [Erythrobacter sp. LQ02-29]